MKKLFYILAVIIFLLGGCREYDDSVKSQQILVTGLNAASAYIIEVDECEYVVYSGYKQGGICHKGNCNNHVR